MKPRATRKNRDQKHSTTQARRSRFLGKILALLLGLGLFAGAAHATSFSHLDDSFETHVQYLQSETNKIDLYYSCPAEWDCDPVNGGPWPRKTHREKMVHMVNFTDQSIRVATSWRDLGWDNEWGSGNGNEGYLFYNSWWGFNTDYRFNTYEDTYYEWSTGGFWRYDDVEAGTVFTIHERLDSMFFVYSTSYCEENHSYCYDDSNLGLSAFSTAANVWEILYICADGGGGTLQWREDSGYFDFVLGRAEDSIGTIVFGEDACDGSENVVIIEGEAATGWLDRDDPGSTGDWETLAEHSLDPQAIPDYLVGIEPAYVEMRRISDQVDIVETGASPSTFDLYSNLGGVVAQGSDDYEVRFHYGWTPWIDRGDPDDGVDLESHSYYNDWSNSGTTQGRMPQRDPTMVQCRAVGYPDAFTVTRDAAAGTDVIEADLGDGQDRLFWCDTEVGFICLNAYNTAQGYASCEEVDVEARFFFGFEEICDGNLLDGLDDGWCNASSGEAKIVARWNSNLCLNAVGNNTASNGTNVNTYYCDYVTERWRFNLETGKIHAAWDDSQCLNAIGNNTATAGTQVNVYDCNSVTETWIYDESTGKIQAGWNSSLCLNAQGNLPTNWSNVNVWNCDSVLETWDIVYE